MQHSPSQIYNVDESGMPLNFKVPNIVAKRVSKKVRYQHAGKKRQITIVNASGPAIPPMVILDAKNLNQATPLTTAGGGVSGVLSQSRTSPAGGGVSGVLSQSRTSPAGGGVSGVLSQSRTSPAGGGVSGVLSQSRTSPAGGGVSGVLSQSRTSPAGGGVSGVLSQSRTSPAGGGVSGVLSQSRTSHAGGGVSGVLSQSRTSPAGGGVSGVLSQSRTSHAGGGVSGILSKSHAVTSRIVSSLLPTSNNNQVREALAVISPRSTLSRNQSSSEAHKQDICSNNSSIIKYLLLPPSIYCIPKEKPFYKSKAFDKCRVTETFGR